jgi:hypothetical protein
MIAPWLVFLAPATALPVPELAPLQAIVGTWKSEAVVSHCDWSPEHRWVVCDQSGTVEGKPFSAISIYGYSVNRKQHVFFTTPDGAKQPYATTLRLEGKTWSYLPVDEADARKFKTTNEFTSADSYVWKVWRSSDGEHWKVIQSGTATRMK